METIPFIVKMPDEQAGDDEMGIFGKFRADDAIGLQAVPVNRLKENLNQVAEAMLTVLDDIKQVGQFQLKEVTLQVEVSARGGVNLIGTASLGGKGAITLKFGA